MLTTIDHKEISWCKKPHFCNGICLSLSENLRLIFKPCAKYYEPCSWGYPDILFTRLLCFVKWLNPQKCRSPLMRNRIYTKANHLNLEINLMSNIMCLPSTVLQMFCSKACFAVLITKDTHNKHN